MRRVLVVLAAVVMIAGMAACSGPQREPLPDDVSIHIDQSRILRKSRTVFLRVHNGSEHDLRITDYTLSSPRFDDVEWSGREIVGAGYEADLEFEMPRGRCGSGVDATLTVTYAIGDHIYRSITHPDDPYDAATAFLDRDCAQQTVTEAATVDVGEVKIIGEGRDAVLELPVTFTPTDRRDDVVLTGIGSTVLFEQTRTSQQVARRALTGQAFTLDLRFVPSRCDAHALADDKVGTLIPVSIAADDLPTGSYYLPLGQRRRVAFFDYYTEACGLSDQ